MSSQVSITQLPQALALTGQESVPIVQSGVTVQTTTGAIAGAGALNYPFLTVGTTVGLTQARYIATNSGLTITDNGAGNTLQVNLIGAALSLDSSGNGIQVKTSLTTVSNVSMAVGTGLTVTNADGTGGNPTIGLGTALQQFVSQTGTGILAIQSGLTAKINILPTTNQISILNGNGAGDVTVGIANNAIFPGTGSVTLPNGTVAQRQGGTGAIRYNTDSGTFEGYLLTGWTAFSTAGGVSSFSAGTTGLLPNTNTTGAVTLSGTLIPANGGTGATTLTGYVYGNGTATMTASLTVPTTDLSGTISNAQLANSSITINGTPISLGGSTSVGTVTSVSVTSANGFSGTVATSTSTPAITISTSITGILKGNGTAISAAVSGTDYAPATSGSAILYGNGSGGFSSVTIGSGVSFVAGTLSATVSGGTVTSVGQTFTGGLISVSGSPITSSGTLALTVAGTSGGIPYFSSGTTWATSAVLAANALMIGGGAAVAPSTITTGTGVVTALGVNTGSAGAFVVNGGALGTPSSGTVTNLTGTASININGTVGATTRNSGDFTTLSANTVTSTTPVLSFNAANTIASFGSTTAGSYNQLVIQNKSGTAGASVNYVLSNDLGTDSSYYGEFGMNSSVFSASTPADFFSINNSVYFSAHDGDVTVGSGNGFKTYLAWGTVGQSAHVINASGALGFSTNLGTTPALSGTTGFGTSGQVLTSQGSAAAPTWSTPSANVSSFSAGTTGLTPSTATTGAVTLAGTLNVANGGTGITSFGTGVATALGQNVTGSGSIVLATSPTLVTPALGTPASGVVTNLTGTASININGTVGATTATTGAFTTISASGVITSTLATGTAPFTVASTTQVANLNSATAGTATNLALAAGTGATNYLTFSATATGNQPLTTNTLLTYNYTNNTLTAGISGGAF